MSALEYLKTALEAYPAPLALQGLERALERLSEADAARVRDAEDVDDVLAVLDPTTYVRVQRVLADLRKLPAGQGSEDALRALLAITDRLDYRCLDAFGFAVECAQARAGEHPCPEELFHSIELDQEGLSFSGPAWYFWGERSEKAMRAARAGFWATVLHEAGLDDKPEWPESIAPDRIEPDGPIAPGLPEALQELVAELEDAEGEDEEIGILREIADAEASGTFAVVDEALWASLSDELRALAGKHDVGVGARLSALIDVALGCAQCWLQADRIRESLIEALLLSQERVGQ
jgi:hypothetical protein